MTGKQTYKDGKRRTMPEMARILAAAVVVCLTVGMVAYGAESGSEFRGGYCE